MIKKSITFVLIFLLLVSLRGWAQARETNDTVIVERGPGGHTLSIDANDIILGEVLAKLIEKYDIKIVLHDKLLASRPISVRFKDLSVEAGIKRVLKAAGIENYIFSYKNSDGNKGTLAELTILGSSGEGESTTITRESLHKKQEEETERSTIPKKKDEYPEDAESFKERYKWENEETKELAGFILEFMPDPVSYPGLNELVDELDRQVKNSKSNLVDEKMLYQAIESIAPPEVTSSMMESVKKYAQKYKSGQATGMTNESPEERHQNFFDKTRKGSF